MPNSGNMVTLLVCAKITMLLWSSLGVRLQQSQASGLLAMLVCGIFADFFISDFIAAQLDTDLAERVVEMILAVLLFIAATEVRGGFVTRCSSGWASGRSSVF